jgi:hypothetical protein
MKKLLIFILLFAGFCSFAQKHDMKSLVLVVDKLDKALINKDSVGLKKILHANLSYGHSNGWVESKRDVIDDLFNGKLSYKQISHKDDQVNIDVNTASVRMVADVDVIFNEKPMQLKLHVLQVWVWNHKHWELFARQSVKIN